MPGESRTGTREIRFGVTEANWLAWYLRLTPIDVAQTYAERRRPTLLRSGLARRAYRRRLVGLGLLPGGAA